MSHPLILALIFGVTAILAGVFLYRRPRSREHVEEIEQGDLARLLGMLLERGYDLGFLVFELPGDERFVEFSKYMKEGRRVGIQLDFPLSPWSEPYYDQVKSLLESRRVPYTVEDTPDGPVREFIQVDFGQDVAAAAATAKDIFDRVFRVDPTVRLTADMEYIAPKA
ncbi:MAG TPA: hypothetical protein VGP80_02425 [Gemmatimonadales bacterium]|nr:hypothetical protein [Gemmatimonadales bacterium]